MNTSKTISAAILCATMYTIHASAEAPEGSCKGLESSQGVYQLNQESSTCKINYHGSVIEIWRNSPGISLRYRSDYDLIAYNPLQEKPQCEEKSGGIYLNAGYGVSYLFKRDSLVKTPYESWAFNDIGCQETFTKIWSPNASEETSVAKPFFTNEGICSIQVYKDRSLAMATVIVTDFTKPIDPTYSDPNPITLGHFPLMTEFKKSMSLQEKMINDGACKASPKPICSIEKFEFTPKGSFKTSMASIKVDSTFLNSYNYTGYDENFEYSNAETIITLVEENFCQVNESEAKNCSLVPGRKLDGDRVRIEIEGASSFDKLYTKEEGENLIEKMRSLKICR
ncbi:MAG: hypothetical protein AB7I27_18925 [Bacteriovoracaceae bacterium]